MNNMHLGVFILLSFEYALGDKKDYPVSLDMSLKMVNDILDAEIDLDKRKLIPWNFMGNMKRSLPWTFYDSWGKQEPFNFYPFKTFPNRESDQHDSDQPQGDYKTIFDDLNIIMKLKEEDRDEESDFTLNELNENEKTNTLEKKRYWNKYQENNGKPVKNVKRKMLLSELIKILYEAKSKVDDSFELLKIQKRQPNASLIWRYLSHPRTNNSRKKDSASEKKVSRSQVEDERKKKLPPGLMN